MPVLLTYGTKQHLRYRTYDLNFHGRVAYVSVPVRSAIWSLNGGPAVDFYVGSVPDPGIVWTFEYEDSPAVNWLKDLGEFNVEVPVSSRQLHEGDNEIIITIVDGDDREERVAVAFAWDPVPLPADLGLRDLAGFSHIREVGQAVDGAFDLDRDQNLIRSRGLVYVDSMFVLGSPHGSQEATYQVRFTDLAKVKWLGPSDFFAGHAGPMPPIGIKPGWSTAGMMVFNPRNEARGLLANGDHVGTDPRVGHPDGAAEEVQGQGPRRLPDAPPGPVRGRRRPRPRPGLAGGGGGAGRLACRGGRRFHPRRVPQVHRVLLPATDATGSVGTKAAVSRFCRVLGQVC